MKVYFFGTLLNADLRRLWSVFLIWGIKCGSVFTKV
jgi:hypothetical protein